MDTVPSIKGSIFGRSVEDLLKLVANEEISHAELERSLEPGDAVYLRKPIAPTGWYDVKAYGRILCVLREVAGNGSNQYLRARGTASAEALLDAGLYQQMSYLNRTKLAAARGAEERYRAFGKDLALLSSMHRVLLNFATQTAKPCPDHADRYILEITDAADYPEPLCWTTDGFINRMALVHESPDLWTWDRPRHDRVVYRMTRPA